jgi:hypothetical protein
MKWVDQSSRNLLESEADDDDEAALLTAKRVPTDQDDASDCTKNFKSTFNVHLLLQFHLIATIPINSPALNVNPSRFKTQVLVDIPPKRSIPY